MSKVGWVKDRCVITQNGCWEWVHSRDAKGYAVVSPYHQRGTGESRVARLVWVLLFGGIREGMWICHRCDNPPCCNPDHLFIGTPQDNNLDTSRKGRKQRRMRCGWCGELGHNTLRHRRND
jgi:hypothetical protein